MNLTLNRCWLSEKSTVGKLLVDEVFECFTLEDFYRGDNPIVKVPKETAIPCGTYSVIIDHSVRFDALMPRVLHVPGFQGIRIHYGNTSADTEGCILVGKDRSADQIFQSRAAYNVLFEKLFAAQGRSEPIVLTIRLTPHLKD